MHHPPRRKGSDLGLLTETSTETETRSLPHLKSENGIVQVISAEESAVLAAVPIHLRKEIIGTKRENEIRYEIGIRKTETGMRMDTEGTRTASDPVYLLAEEKILNLGKTATLERMKRMKM